MSGLLADVNLQGHLPYLVRLIKEIGVLELLTDIGITFETFPDRGPNVGGHRPPAQGGRKGDESGPKSL